MSFDPHEDRPDNMDSAGDDAVPEHDLTETGTDPADPALDAPYSLPHRPVTSRFAEQPAIQQLVREEPDRRWNRGFILTLLSVGGIVIALTALVLFLPPVSLWNKIDTRLNDPTEDATQSPDSSETGWTDIELGSSTARIEKDGLVLTTDTTTLTESFGVQVTVLSSADYLAENIPAKGWYCATDLPPHHTLAGPVYSLAQRGTPPQRLTLQVTDLSDEGNSSTLELYSWNATSGTWQFLPVQRDANAAAALTTEIIYLPRCVALFRATESIRQVGVTLALKNTFSPNIAAANMRLYPGSLRPTATGALHIVLASGFQTGQGYDVIPLIQNFDDPAVIDGMTVQHILENATLREEHARQIAAFVLTQDGYTGIALDYRAIPRELRDAYTVFLRNLAYLLHGQDRTLTVILPRPTFDESTQTWDTGAYHWPDIGRIVDEVVIQALLDPQGYLPNGNVDALLTWATTQISRDKLQLGLDALSVEDYGNGSFAPIALADALAYVGAVQLDPGATVTSGQTLTAQLVHPAGIKTVIGNEDGKNYLRYLDVEGNTLRTIWLTGPDALFLHQNRATFFNLGGVFVWNAMSPGTIPNWENALLAYRLGQTPPAAPELTLEWIVREGDTEIARTPGQFGAPFTYPISNQAGTLTLEAWFSGVLLDSQTVNIMAAEPTALPTPLPTSMPEPTLTPLLLPTPTVILPTSTPATSAEIDNTPVPLPTEGVPTSDPTGAVPAFDLNQSLPIVDPSILAAGQIGAEFEAGVHMGGITPTILEVVRMHLTWVKIDVPYRLGQAPEDWLSVIDTAHGNGFKVLLNVVGDPFEFSGTDRAAYLAQYTQYVGGLAAQGTDGIEVWREMNGRMTPEEYIQLLAWSYYTIKTAHPDTLVISGALRPTAIADNLDEDDNAYYTRLGEAGISQFADCIGTQYIIGTVPPLSTSGDLRGNNTIYYLPTANDRARQAAGGILPVCYTRLGYLSPAGYPSLPEDYAWAQQITVGQQAQWLTDALRLSKEGTQVRLVIIWSLDAAVFGGGSPEAGYAIIRPDGTCPACELIAPLFEP